MALISNEQLQTRIKLLLKDARFLFVKMLIEAHPKADVYLVGGAVRDLLLGRETKDYDFVVRNVPIKKIQALLETLGAVNMVGKRFGVLKFAPKAKGRAQKKLEPFDIALPRLEFSEEKTGHYRDFFVKTDHRLDIVSDLSRRDFTINALAWDIRLNVLRDPFRGLGDLERGIIRAVGNPDCRFREDYSRMLRAISFSCQLGFSIEERTRGALAKNARLINKEIRPTKNVRPARKDANTLRVVPYEVVSKEMVRAFVADPVRAFDSYDSFGLFDALAPEMKSMRGCPQDPRWHSEGDVWIHTRLALSHVAGKAYVKEFDGEHPDATLIFAVLFHDIGKAYTIQTPEKDSVDRIRFHGHDRVGADIAKTIVERLRLSSVESAKFESGSLHWLIRNHLLLLNSDIRTMKNNTIEKYFFQDAYLGATLVKLIFVDSLATVRKDGKSSMGNYRRCVARLKTFVRKAGGAQTLPKPILSGNDVMRTFHMGESPAIGDMLRAVREEQLAGRVRTKRRALAFLRKKMKRRAI